jgi:hypothetical protein
MARKSGRPAVLCVLAGTLLFGCTAATPNYCQQSRDCPAGSVCDVVRAVCIASDAAVDAKDGAYGFDLRSSDVPYASEVAVDQTMQTAEVAVDAADQVDAPEGAIDSSSIEAMGVDLSVPDAPGTCSTSGDCSDPSKPFCTNNVCVGCQAAGVTACGARVCDATSGKCVECTLDNHCDKDPAKGFCVANACAGCQVGPATACAARSTSKPVCAAGGTLGGQCVECAADTDCKSPEKSFCIANMCAGCQASSAAACSARSASKPACAASGTLGGQCVECAADTDCKTPEKSFCVANACASCQSASATACPAKSTDKPVCAASGKLVGQCVACQADADCKAPAAPICNDSNACVKCTSDSQCAAKLGSDPGVCMAHQDGRCATDGETVYVANVSGCSSSDTGGTANQPLCTLQAAVTRLSTSAAKRLIVLRSSADGVSVTSATQVSIVGQNSASIATGAVNAGITVSGTGNLFVRNLNVIGSSVSTMGISAGPGTTLELEGAKVLNNGGGGILLNGAAFDLRDVLVSGNGTGIDGSTTWSGIYVKALPNAGTTTQLSFVSVVNNGSPGLNCVYAVPTVPGSAGTVYASGNGGAGGINIIPICGITTCMPALAGTCGSSLAP